MRYTCGIGGNGDVCSFQARTLESPAEYSTFILPFWIGQLETTQQWFKALEVSEAVGVGGSPKWKGLVEKDLPETVV